MFMIYVLSYVHEGRGRDGGRKGGWGEKERDLRGFEMEGGGEGEGERGDWRADAGRETVR